MNNILLAKKLTKCGTCLSILTISVDVRMVCQNVKTGLIKHVTRTRISVTPAVRLPIIARYKPEMKPDRMNNGLCKNNSYSIEEETQSDVVLQSRIVALKSMAINYD